MKFSDWVENAAWVVFFLGFLTVVLFIVGTLGAVMYSELDCQWRPESKRCQLLHERSQQ